MLAALGSDPTLADEAALVDDAISFARIAAQHAPSGHPIFAAITNAEAVRSYIQGQIPWYSVDGGAAPQSVVEMQVDAQSRIYDAAADIRNDPNAPLAPTIWEKVKALNWPLVAGGLGALMLAGVYFTGRRRRAA